MKVLWLLLAVAVLLMLLSGLTAMLEPEQGELAPPVPVMVQRCAQARSHYLRLHHLPPAP